MSVFADISNWIKVEKEHMSENEYWIQSAMIQLQKDIFNTAEASGWHSRDRELPEAVALMHSELSEALEEYRNGKDETLLYYSYKGDLNTEENSRLSVIAVEDEEGRGEHVLGKPEGVASEIADVIIRALDYSEEKKIPTIEALIQKMKYNKTRPYRHGGKVV